MYILPNIDMYNTFDHTLVARALNYITLAEFTPSHHCSEE